MATDKGQKNLKHIAYGLEPPDSATLAKLTDNSGGAADDTLAAVEATYTQATIRNNFADLAAKVNAILDLLQDMGIRK